MAEHKTDRDGSGLKELISSCENLPFGFLSFESASGKLTACNHALVSICGYPSEDAFFSGTKGQWQNLFLMEDPVRKNGIEESRHGVLNLRGYDRSVVECRYTKQILTDQNGTENTVLYLSDYDENQDNNVYDPVSRMYQKEGLFTWVSDQVKAGSSLFQKENWNLIFVNITGFKQFNDDCGYSEGNKLLRAFAKLAVKVFNTRLITRVYADHFACLYCGDDVEKRVQELHEEALNLRNDFLVWTSAGIYPIHNWDGEMDVFLDYARTACGEAQKSRQISCVYSKELAVKLEKKKYIVSHIDEAIEKGWIVLYFQPVIRTLSGKICSGEALARWKDPVYGMISPGEFVPVLEENGLSYKLAEFVIDEACGYISEADRMGMYPIPVSINLSRRDFDEMDPFACLEKAVKKYGISRNLLCIEITESTVMDNPDKIRRYISLFHEAGYEVWMDDFGSAYSSLNALKDFAFDEIKMDMVFMRNFNEKGKKIIASCIDMAKELGIRTLCEGVETREQAEFLLEHGCEKIQGFYYSRPRPVAEIKELIDQGKFSYELSVERFLYDEAGRIRMNPQEEMAVLLCPSEDTLIPLEMSRSLKEAAEKDGFRPVQLRRPLDLDDTELGQKIRHVVHNCHLSGKKEEISYFLNGRYFMLTAEQAGTSNAGYICALRIHDITSSARGIVFANAGGLAQSLADIYDCIYELDFEHQRIRVILSNFSGESSGKTFAFDPESMMGFIWWKDRDRFRRWMDASRMDSFLKDSKLRSVSDLFRMVWPDGTRRWELYTLIHNGESRQDQLYLCMKPADASMQAMAELAEEKGAFLDPLSSENEKSEALLGSALLEQNTLKLFRKDREGRFTGVSRSFLEFFGLASEKSVLGKTMAECPWLLDGKEAGENEEAVIRDGRESTLYASRVLVNGAVKNTVVLKFPLYEDGKICGLAGVFVSEDELKAAMKETDRDSGIDEDTGVMSFVPWLNALTSFENAYSHHDSDYAIGVIMIRSYWKTYHEFGRKIAEEMARTAAETIQAELPSDCMLGRMDGETFVIVSVDHEGLRTSLQKITSILASTHYIGPYAGAILSNSASVSRSETSNMMRTISLALETGENAANLKSMSNERSPRMTAVEPVKPEDSIVSWKEMSERIQALLHTFDFVRLSDPENQKIIRYERNGVWKEQKGHCFDVWQSGEPCANCISSRALKNREKLTKFETDGKNIFIVIAQYMEVEGRPCVLEMVLRMHDSSVLGSDERGILIRTLANCRSRMYEDTLTGVHNRRYYEDVLADHMGSGCALIDIEKMDEVNRTYGHLAGDTVLQECARVIASHVNVSDLARYEGYRFILCFTKLPQEEGQKVLDQILKGIENLSFADWPNLQVHACAGSVFRRGRIRHLIQDADKALSEAEKKDQSIQ